MNLKTLTCLSVLMLVASACDTKIYEDYTTNEAQSPTVSPTETPTTTTTEGEGEEAAAVVQYVYVPAEASATTTETCEDTVTVVEKEQEKCELNSDFTQYFLKETNGWARLVGKNFRRSEFIGDLLAEEEFSDDLEQLNDVFNIMGVALIDLDQAAIAMRQQNVSHLIFSFTKAMTAADDLPLNHAVMVNRATRKTITITDVQSDPSGVTYLTLVESEQEAVTRDTQTNYLKAYMSADRLWFVIFPDAENLEYAQAFNFVDTGAQVSYTPSQACSTIMDVFYDGTDTVNDDSITVFSKPMAVYSRLYEDKSKIAGSLSLILNHTDTAITGSLEVSKDYFTSIVQSITEAVSGFSDTE